MARKNIITGEVIEAAIKTLDKLIATPPSPREKTYTRKEAFLALRAKAKGALAAGHSLESVLEALRKEGIETSASTARQYLKPSRHSNKSKIAPKAVPV